MQMYRKNAYKSMRSGHGPKLKVRMSELSKVIYGQKSVEELTGMMCYIYVFMLSSFFSGGLNLLHEADDDAVIWLGSTATASLAK